MTTIPMPPEPDETPEPQEDAIDAPEHEDELFPVEDPDTEWPDEPIDDAEDDVS